jgi:hypothetical protein
MKRRITNDRIAELLETAADKLESGKLQWTRGRFRTIEENDDGCLIQSYCAIGAMREVANYDLELVDAATNPLAAQVRDTVLALKPPSIQAQIVSHWPMHNYVIEFNDLVAKGPSEVAEAMKLAAKDLRNQHE